MQILTKMQVDESLNAMRLGGEFEVDGVSKRFSGNNECCDYLYICAHSYLEVGAVLELTKNDIVLRDKHYYIKGKLVSDHIGEFISNINIKVEDNLEQKLFTFSKRLPQIHLNTVKKIVCIDVLTPSAFRDYYILEFFNNCNWNIPLVMNLLELKTTRYLEKYLEHAPIEHADNIILSTCVE